MTFWIILKSQPMHYFKAQQAIYLIAFIKEKKSYLKLRPNKTRSLFKKRLRLTKIRFQVHGKYLT